jgi:nicotinamidase/pyrazinamidase
MSASSSYHEDDKPGVDARAAEYGPRVALIVVDMQNDFAEPAGSLHVEGGSEIVGIVNSEIRRALDSGATVVHTQDWHPSHTPHFAQDGGIWPVHCVAGTWGAALQRDLLVGGPIVRKGSHGEDGYSGFTMRDPENGRDTPTELQPTLAGSSITQIVVCGLATDYCVKATALDGVRLGYPTSLLVDAVRAVDLTPGDGDRALAEMVAAGVVLVGERSPAA